METDTDIPIDDQDIITLPLDNLVKDYSIAYNIVTEAIETYEGYWDLIKICQKHIAGEKPIPPEELKRKGMGWVNNFNYGKARAKIEKGVAENVAKASSAISLGYCTFREFDDDKGILAFLEDPNTRGSVAAITGYCLSTTLSKEVRLSNYLNEIEYPSYSFGYCSLQYDPLDWMPEVYHPLNVAFPKNTKPDEISRWVTFSSITPEELYQYWAFARNESTKVFKEKGQKVEYASSGWNIDALEKVLLQAWRGKGTGSYKGWDDVMPEFRQDSSKVISQTDSVHIAKLYIKELNGNLSEIYIPYNNPWQIENKNKSAVDMPDTDAILFRKNHGKYRQSERIQIIRDSGFSETGFIEDFRGIAKYSVEDGIRYNRIRNNLANKAIFAGAPMFDAPNGQVAEKFKITVSSPFIILNQGYNLIERQPSFDISTQIGLLTFEEREYNRDTQQYDPTIEGRLTSRPNRGEVQRVTQEVDTLANSKNNVKFRDYSAVFKTVLKRMHEVKAKDGDPGYEGLKRFYSLMKKNLAPYGVETDEDVNLVLSAIDSYVIEPVISNISTINAAIQMAETPFARNRFKRMLLIAQGLPIEEVNLGVPLIADKFASIQDDRIAAFENDMFFNTNEILIGPADDHITHLDSHFGKSQRVIIGFQEGRLSAKDAYAFLSNAASHSIRHIELLGEDPSLNGRAQEYFEQFKLLESQRKQIGQVAQQQAEQQAQEAAQPQIDPKTANEIASDNAKAIADTRRKDALAASRTAQREQQIENSHEARLRELELKYSTQPQV